MTDKRTILITGVAGYWGSEVAARLAAGGRRGVAHALEILRTEILRDMALLGVRRISEIGERHLRACD